MNEKVLRCAIYIRVSTAEQAMHGKSLGAQLDFLTAYANEHGMKVVGVFADEGKSARKNFKYRKEIKRLLQSVEHDEIDVILFWKLDRWFRNVADFYKVQDILDAHGTKWIAVAEPNLSMDTRDGRLQLNMYLSIGQNETDTTSERIKFVNDASIRQGKVVYGTQSMPFGYTIGIVDGQKKMVKDTQVEHIVDEAFRYFMVHQSKRGTVKYINEKYGPVISMQTIHSMLTNMVFCGKYRDNADYCPAYITREEFAAIQEINKKNIKDYTSRKGHQIYLFTGMIKCPMCGRKLSSVYAQRYLVKGKKEPQKMVYKYYRCQNQCNNGTCTYTKITNEATYENYLLQNIMEELEAWKVEIQATAEKQKPAKKVDKQKLLKEIDRLNTMFQKGRITEEKYDSEYECLQAQLSECPTEPTSAHYDFSRLDRVLYDGWQNTYSNLDPEHKRAFWRSIIDELKVDPDTGRITKVFFLQKMLY